MRRDLPPLRLLSVFETVLRAGGVRNAAAALNVSQPAVSQAIAALEDHLGAKLFDRRQRPATPTEAGQLLAAAVTYGFDRIGDAVGEIRALGAAERDTVTVACTICTGTYWLMPRLAAFHRLHPEVTVRVATSPGNPRMMPGTDLLIRYGDGLEVDGTSDLLFAERLVPVCSPQAAARLGFGDFAGATLIHVDAERQSWPGWEDYFAATGIASARAGDVVFSNYVEATQAAIAGLGVALGWVSNCGDLLAEGRLAIFRDAPFVPGGGFHLVKPKQADKKVVALFAAHLKRCVAGAEA